jgi:glycosyltransferase involved in cell wall biosynthesis
MKFSVVIPLYNKEKEIARTLDSVFSQSYPPSEVIVVNDGSTDKGPLIVRSRYGERVKLLEQKNCGDTCARNKGISHAIHEYIALIDADDLWEENFLQEIRDLIDRYPDAAFYSTASKSIDEAGNIIKNDVGYDEEFRGLIDNLPDVYNKHYGILNASSVCIRKSLFDRGVKFKEGVRRGGDIAYWLELSLQGPLAFSAKPLSIYRLDASNRSGEIYKEAIVPEQLRWYYENETRLKVNKYGQSMRKFIHRNMLVTSYGLALDGNLSSVRAIVHYMFHKNDYYAFLLLPALVMPKLLLKWMRWGWRKFR